LGWRKWGGIRGKTLPTDDLLVGGRVFTKDQAQLFCPKRGPPYLHGLEESKRRIPHGRLGDEEKGKALKLLKKMRNAKGEFNFVLALLQDRRCRDLLRMGGREVNLTYQKFILLERVTAREDEHKS